MELKPSRITNFKVIKPSNVADSDENYAVMASFNQVYTLIKVSKKAAESSALQIWKRPESSVIYFLQKAEEQNLADSFALWALRAAIRGALSQTDGNSCFCTTVWRNLTVSDLTLPVDDTQCYLYCQNISNVSQLLAGYKKFQTVGLTGYHLLHLSAVDAEKGSKINLTLACRSVRAMLLDEKFLILGTVDVRVQNGSALIFTFTAP